jgi:polysaccharide biosynthesis/export protein
VNPAAAPRPNVVRRPRARSALGPLALAALLAVGCRTTEQPFVWADTIPMSVTEGPYLISPGDTLSVRVFNQEGISGLVRVRADGMITMTFLNDVEAAGLTPVQLAQRLQTRLTEFLVNPVVTVALQETRPLAVSVIGDVQHPGIYRLDSGAGVVSALAAASGLTEFADRERIFVVRGGTLRIRFTYAALMQPGERAAQFRLQPGDVVVVE